MSRVRGCQALIEFLSNETGGQAGVPDDFNQNLDATSPVASTSRVLQSMENQRRKNTGTQKNFVRCICGKPRHFSKLICDFCGFNKTRRVALDWNTIKKRAPKSPSYTTKRLFDRVFQLHAAHNRDIVVLMHCKDGQGEKFRYYATPGRAEVFLSGRLGNTIKSAWCSVHHPEFKIQDDSDCGPSKKKKLKYMKEAGLIDETPGNGNAKMSTDSSSESEDEGEVDKILNKRLYERFHVDAKPGNENAKISTSSSSESEDEGEIYEVDKVLDKRRSETGEIEYLVKWRGWSSFYNSWEPETNIIDKGLIKNF